MPPTITVITREIPPVADLFLDDLPATTAYVWLWRMWANREVRVRGDAATAVIGDQARIEDYDLPLNQPVQYRLQAFADDGSELDITGHEPSDPLTIALEDLTTAWISDPLAPALSRLMALGVSTDQSRTYVADTVWAQVIGQQAPVAIAGTRSAAADWVFEFKSYSHEESTALEALVAGGGTLLIRSDPTLHRHATGLIYLSAPSIVENPRHDMVNNPGRADWVLTGREARPPGLGVLMPTRQYQDFLEEALDYVTLRDMYPDYLAALRG